MSIPAPTEEDIQRIVDLVVAEVHPLQVVLFGSAARGEQHDGSDVDLMIVVPEDADRSGVADALYALMYRERVSIPTQFVVTTPSSFERHRTSLGLVYREIARDGREMYAA